MNTKRNPRIFSIMRTGIVLILVFTNFAGIFPAQIASATSLTATGSAPDNLEDPPPVPQPWIDARYHENEVHGYGWTWDTSVTLTVDDPANGVGADYTDAQTVVVSEADPSQTFVAFRLWEDDFELENGHTLTMSDGITTKTHVIAVPVITSVEPEVEGLAAPFAEIWVDLPGITQQVTADATGHWSTDTSSISFGEEAWEGEARFQDEDGDATSTNWGSPYLLLTLRPDGTTYNWIEGMGGWPGRSQIFLAVDDPGTPQNPDYTDTARSRRADGKVQFDYVGFHDHPGFTITLSNGYNLTRAITVPIFTVTGHDLANGTIWGTASQSTTVKLVHCINEDCSERAQREVTADSNGNWLANFAVSNGPDEVIYDIRLGDGFDPHIYDEDGDTAIIRWSVTNPLIFGVLASDNWIGGNGWQSWSIVRVGIDDLATPQNPDATAAYDTDENGNFGGRSEYDITVGSVITATDGYTTKQVTVSNFAVTSIDWDADTISGIGTPDATANLWGPGLFGWGPIAIDSSGHWRADLAGVVNLVAGSQGFAIERDSDGDGTQSNWRVPNAQMNVDVANDFLCANDWPAGAVLTLTIDDPANGTGTDLTRSATVGPQPGNPNQFNACFDLKNQFDIQPGQEITVSGGGFTKVHVARNVTITQADIEADTVSGPAEAGTEVKVWVNDANWVFRSETADSNGMWSANYHVPGDGQGEEATFDLQPGTHVMINVPDDDNDTTTLHWFVPFIKAAIYGPGHNVEGEGWPLGSSVTLTVDNPGNGTGVDCTDAQTVGLNDWGGTQVRFELEDFRLETGALVTLTDGITTRTHTVAYLDITDVDTEADRVFGKTGPGDTVQVSFGNGSARVQRTVAADSNGNWVADFSIPGSGEAEQSLVNIRPGMGFSADRYGNGRNFTSLYWEVPDPKVIAYSDEDVIAATDFWPGSTVTITIDDPDNGVGVDFTRSGQVDTVPGGWNCQTSWGYCFVTDLWNEFDVQAGQLITITDGSHTVSHVVTALAMTSFDVIDNTVSGTAEPLSEINLSLWPSCGERHLFTDAEGNWLEDFSIPGDENFEQETCDFSSDPIQYVVAYQASGQGETWVNLNRPNPFLWVWPRNRGPLETFGWSPGAEVTLTVDNPATPQNPDYGPFLQVAEWAVWGRQTIANFDLSFDISAGHVISVTDGTITKTHTVTSLEITDIDPETDIVTGIAAPDSLVEIWADGSESQQITADGSGNWFVDFTGIDDIGPDTWIEASQLDEDGDSTLVWSAGRDTDNDGEPDVLDPCPAEATNMCNQAGSTAGIIGAEGGELVTENGKITLNVPAEALDNSITLSITDEGSGYELASDQGSMTVVHSYSIQPNGTQFDPPATITFRWADADDDGIVDGTTYPEAELLLVKDGLVITTSCGANPGCHLTANELAVQVSSLSLFALALHLNQPPHAELGPDRAVREGKTLKLDAYASSDPEAGPLTYAWDLDNDGEFDDATGVTTTMTFPDNGNFTVRLQVTDAGGLSDVDQVIVTVNNVPPVILSLKHKPTIQAGMPLNVTAKFQDPGSADTFTADWKWGDGTKSKSVVTAHTVTVSHVYTRPGIYIMKLTLTDRDGGSDSAFSVVVVRPGR